jgi:hypothetical protein
LTSAAAGDVVVQLRANVGQTYRRSSFALVGQNGKDVVSISFNDAGCITSRDPKGHDVDIVGYRANRWYTIRIDVSLKSGRFGLRVEDDRLDTKLVENLALDCPAGGSVEGIMLRHASDRSGSWIVYDALLAYNRD